MSFKDAFIRQSALLLDLNTFTTYVKNEEKDHFVFLCPTS